MKTKNSHLLDRTSMIVAQVVVSESEIKEVLPDFNSATYALHNILYNLGMDVSKGIEQQNGLMHRNRLNKVVKCPRWVGEERQDEEWINSGYASQEALDKYSGNRILEDLYRSKNLTQDAQIALEERDKYTKIDESEWTK
jgi:hypothetical protein